MGFQRRIVVLCRLMSLEITIPTTVSHAPLADVPLDQPHNALDQSCWPLTLSISTCTIQALPRAALPGSLSPGLTAVGSSLHFCLGRQTPLRPSRDSFTVAGRCQVGRPRPSAAAAPSRTPHSRGPALALSSSPTDIFDHTQALIWIHHARQLYYE